MQQKSSNILRTTLTEENYLKALFHLVDAESKVTINDLSKFLNVKMPSVNNMMKKFAEKEEFRGRLQEKLEEISEQIKVVESLDEQIWNEINPLAVTLKDAEKIAAIARQIKSATNSD